MHNPYRTVHTNCGTLAGMRNSSMGPLRGIDLTADALGNVLNAG